MDFTREPIIESVVTPKEGCKLVIRSSKGVGQEEFFVDAVEIVSFGGTFFLRSKEKPKAFLVPATDYEILEIREARMVLKNVPVERSSIKIAGGKTEPPKRPKEPVKTEVSPQESEPEEKPLSRKKERRKQYRKKKETEVVEEQEKNNAEIPKRVKIPAPENTVQQEREGHTKPLATISTVLTSLLPPPSTLISESIERYKGNELFKNVFIPKEESSDQKKENQEGQPVGSFEDEPTVELEAPERYDHYAEDDIFDLPPVEPLPEQQTLAPFPSPLEPPAHTPNVDS